MEKVIKIATMEQLERDIDHLLIQHHGSRRKHHDNMVEVYYNKHKVASKQHAEAYGGATALIMAVVKCTIDAATITSTAVPHLCLEGCNELSKTGIVDLSKAFTDSNQFREVSQKCLSPAASIAETGRQFFENRETGSKALLSTEEREHQLRHEQAHQHINKIDQEHHQLHKEVSDRKQQKYGAWSKMS